MTVLHRAGCVWSIVEGAYRGQTRQQKRVSNGGVPEESPRKLCWIGPHHGVLTSMHTITPLPKFYPRIQSLWLSHLKPRGLLGSILTNGATFVSTWSWQESHYRCKVKITNVKQVTLAPCGILLCLALCECDFKQKTPQCEFLAFDATAIETAITELV